MPPQAAKIVVRGRVQGVGFRYWALRQARALALRGWVRNRSDGSVEILAIGEPAALEQLAASAQEGPPSARVSNVRMDPAADDGSDGFSERATL